MKVVTVEPRAARSLRLEERPEFAADRTRLLVKLLCIGVGSTDHDIVLHEAANIPAGAWDDIGRIGRLIESWKPRTVLITGVAALAAADRRWSGRVIARRKPLERWRGSFERGHGDVEVISRFAGSPA